LSAQWPLDPTLARAAWHEALRLPQRTVWLICGLIALTTAPVSIHMLWLGEHTLAIHGWIAAAIVGVCELTLLFPLIQATTLPFLRRLKGGYPGLSLAEDGAPDPPQRAYFLASMLAATLVVIVLVARLIALRYLPPVNGAEAFPAAVAIALAILCFAAMFGGIGWQLHLSVLLPLRTLAGAMNRFAGGQPVKPLGLPHVGEIGMLAEHFDAMVFALERSRADLEEKEALLRHAQRFDAMGLMAASLVHEIANPLAGLRLSLAVAAENVSGAATRPDASQAIVEADELLKGVRQATDLIGGLLLEMKVFGRREDEGKEHCNLSSILEMALRIVRTETRGSVSIRRDFQPAPPVMGNALKLTQVFVNLLLNAIEAVQSGSPTNISVGVRLVGDTVEAWVEDNGLGIGPEAHKKLFCPMYSKKADGTGSGLGLYICKQIVEAHGGRIACKSSEGRGSIFLIGIPHATAGL
jgi:signal transduction histidine kinase